MSRNRRLRHGLLEAPDPNVEDQQLTQILDELRKRGPMTMNEIERETEIRINVITWRVDRLRKEDRVHVDGYRACSVTGRTNMVLKAGPAPSQQLTLGGFW